MLIKILYLSNSLETLVRFFGKIGAWLSIPLIFIIIFDIITRRFFILGSTKIQEMEWHLHTAIFMLALGFAYIKNSHVRIEIIREKYSSTLKSFFEVIGILFFLVPYTCMIIYYGFDFVSRSYNLNEVSSALTGLSHRWIIKSFIPLGMLLLFLAGVSILLRNTLLVVARLKKDSKSLTIIYEKYPELNEIKKDS